MKVELTVDGKAIPLNDFTQAIIGNVVTAIADSLRGVAAGQKDIAIRVRKD